MGRRIVGGGCGFEAGEVARAELLMECLSWGSGVVFLSLGHGAVIVVGLCGGRIVGRRILGVRVEHMHHGPALERLQWYCKACEGVLGQQVF